MKAIVCHTYGSPDLLKCEEIETPTPGDDEILIQVRAAAVNPLDWHLMRGTPYLGRLTFGLFRPKETRPGRDVAGRVEAVGRNVTRFQPGDEVFGVCRGALAEYACTSESAVGLKPKNVTFEQAASAPVAALTALQGLRDRGRVQPGQKVLIHGAAGGVGTFAVQIAKWLGAEVTGVCSTRNLDLVRSLGADQVTDYTREDFTGSGRHYHLFFDCVGDRSLSACRRVLNPKGTYVVVGVRPEGRWIGPLARLSRTVVLSWFVRQNLRLFMAKRSAEDLATIGDLMSGGRVTPVIDRRYRLGEAAEAIRHLAEGHARGKVVINIEHGSKA